MFMTVFQEKQVFVKPYQSTVITKYLLIEDLINKFQEKIRFSIENVHSHNKIAMNSILKPLKILLIRKSILY